MNKCTHLCVQVGDIQIGQHRLEYHSAPNERFVYLLKIGREKTQNNYRGIKIYVWAAVIFNLTLSISNSSGNFVSEHWYEYPPVNRAYNERLFMFEWRSFWIWSTTFSNSSYMLLWWYLVIFCWTHWPSIRTNKKCDSIPLTRKSCICPSGSHFESEATQVSKSSKGVVYVE